MNAARVDTAKRIDIADYVIEGTASLNRALRAIALATDSYRRPSPKKTVTVDAERVRVWLRAHYYATQTEAKRHAAR